MKNKSGEKVIEIFNNLIDSIAWDMLEKKMKNLNLSEAEQELIK